MNRTQDICLSIDRGKVRKVFIRNLRQSASQWNKSGGSDALFGTGIKRLRSIHGGLLQSCHGVCMLQRETAFASKLFYGCRLFRVGEYGHQNMDRVILKHIGIITKEYTLCMYPIMCRMYRFIAWVCLNDPRPLLTKFCQELFIYNRLDTL